MWHMSVLPHFILLGRTSSIEGEEVAGWGKGYHQASSVEQRVKEEVWDCWTLRSGGRCLCWNKRPSKSPIQQQLWLMWTESGSACSWVVACKAPVSKEVSAGRTRKRSMIQPKVALVVRWASSDQCHR